MTIILANTKQVQGSAQINLFTGESIELRNGSSVEVPVDPGLVAETIAFYRTYQSVGIVLSIIPDPIPVTPVEPEGADDGQDKTTTPATDPATEDKAEKISEEDEDGDEGNDPPVLVSLPNDKVFEGDFSEGWSDGLSFKDLVAIAKVYAPDLNTVGISKADLIATLEG